MSLDAPHRARRLVRRALDVALPTRLWLARGPRAAKAVHLTFDDGPHPEHTPAVLEALGRRGALGTFFVVGARAAAHPELVRAIVAQGHGLGHHSYHHRDPAMVGARELGREMARTVDLLESLVGYRPRLFRPPHGSLTPGKLLAAWTRGDAVALWSRDPADYGAPDAEATLCALARPALRGGDVVLLHDVNPRAARVVEALLPALAARGLSATPLPGSRP